MNPQELSNKELYALCKQYGKNVRKWSREFGFLLPEVAKRGMYRKYHCTSIYEFAAKLASMSHDIVDRILSLAGKLEDKPCLRNLFKRYGWSKLAVVGSIATADTDEFWADKVKRLPRRALHEYIKVWNKNNKMSDLTIAKPLTRNLFDLVTNKNTKSQKNDLPQSKTGGSTEFGYEIQPVSVQNSESQNIRNTKTFRKLRLRVDEETEFEFRKFKQAMEKEKKETFTMGETLKFLLKKVKELENQNVTIRQIESARQSAMVSRACHESVEGSNQDISKHVTKPVTRYNPPKIQTSIIATYNGRCAFPGCNEPYAELHHPDRFALKKSHQRIYPLCKIHHQAAHSGLIKNEDQSIEKWKFDMSTTATQSKGPSTSRLENIFDLYQASQKDYVDSKVRSHWIT